MQFRWGKKVKIFLCIFFIWLHSGHKEMHLSVSILLFPLCRGTIWEAEVMGEISLWAEGSFPASGDLRLSFARFSIFHFKCLMCFRHIGQVKLEKSKDTQWSTAGLRKCGNWNLTLNLRHILMISVTGLQISNFEKLQLLHTKITSFYLKIISLFHIPNFKFSLIGLKHVNEKQNL